MKNTSQHRTRHLFQQIFNIRLWFDWERMKAFTQYLLQGCKTFLVPQKAQVTESFEEAMARLGLTDSDLLARQKGLLRLSLLTLGFAILLLGYAIYHVFYGSLLAVMLSVVLMCVTLVLAFRYHFWYFQIKKRKLGCTIREWFKQGLMGGK